MIRRRRYSIFYLLFILLICCSCNKKTVQVAPTTETVNTTEQTITEQKTTAEQTIASTETPETTETAEATVDKPVMSATGYSGAPACTINDGIPYFTEDEFTTTSFERYSDLDELGRCGVAYACIGMDIMPTEKRGEIGMIKPSGWHTSKYDKSVISDLYLYNRCHLIAYMLAGENANEKNLITGTRYLNVEGMLPVENLVHAYIMKEPSHHVLYRVTPIYNGNNLVAEGVLMEGASVEDDQLRFCVFCYNVQPGIVIDYATGDNRLAEDGPTETNTEAKQETTYVLNTNSKKIHLPSCDSVKEMKPGNKKETTKSIKELEAEGYTRCGKCNPK